MNDLENSIRTDPWTFIAKLLHATQGVDRGLQGHLPFLNPFKKKICPVTRVQLVDCLQLEEHSVSISLFKPVSQSWQAALIEWLRKDLFISVLHITSLTGILCPGPLELIKALSDQHLHEDSPCPFLISLHSPFTDLKSASYSEGFLCSILLSLTFIFHRNQSPKSFRTPNIVSVSLYWWLSWHRQWLLRKKRNYWFRKDRIIAAEKPMSKNKTISSGV